MADFDSRPGRVRARAACLLALVLLAQGCASFGPWKDTGVADEAYFGSELSILSTHLETMRALAESDHGEQERIFDETRFAAEATRTSSRKLRLALALAVPGHPSSNAAKAYKLLTELLAAPDALLNSERRLAQVQLADLRQRMILEAEVASLIEQVQTRPRPRRAPVTPAPTAALTERVTELEMQNEQLATELQAARAKLEAVTAIESDDER